MFSVRNLVAIGTIAGLCACTQAPDMSAIDREHLKQVQRYDIVQALASNDKVVVAGTQSSAVLVSTDSGKSWSRRTLGPVSMIGMAACPDGSFVGIDFNHKLWSADAQGAGWKSVLLDKPRTPLAVTCDNKSQWWVVGSGSKIVKSADRGANWQVTDFGEDAQFTTVQFVDEAYGVAMGEFGLVAITQDGGATWKKTAKIPADFYPYAALFLDRKEGYASGIAGQILHTTDGAITWAKVANQTNAPLYQLFLHGGKPYGVGAAGVVARLDGGAFRFMPYPDAAPVFLGAGVSLKAQQAIAIGGPGGLVRVISTQAN